LRSEWLKLVTVRSPGVRAGITVLVGGSAAFLVARFVTDEVITVANVFAGTLGLGVGLIARQSAAAISGVLAWWLVIENLVAVFAPERVVRFMPFFAGNGMLEIVDNGERIAFHRPATTLIFAAYAMAALLIGSIVVHRSDP